ncbi:RsmB/NOP family class I SAM-dependent RNA methyltransferase [Paracoccus sp. DMF-8]|uniref:RsmB/NOP family class I SAM-dependent RNA methyltransferase n=1 Tax=Paracoccus sp. DMF-8 TaxID=3019445 RepID=UPI0023E463DA|nr:RsmB/NOP family class I SAM-dependent RNA methyltransferase [Paracoccus sp. DMF-8]MDF3607852.1 RsmB/NOP family class I SAM-dependent RNA methyltransferase [Paracoccus sp. DMF-8]
MTPAARFAAAIDILDRFLAGEPAEAALTRWARGSRFAGSGDRAGVRDLVYDSLRRLRSRAALGGAMTGRSIMLGACRELGQNPAMFFNGEGFAPAPLTIDEISAGHTPTPSEACDLPDWLLGRWQAALGADADRIAQAMRERAPVWLRVNAMQANVQDAMGALIEEDILVEPSDLLPYALRITQGERRLANSRAYLDGLVELQDLSAQLACAALPLEGRILDLCAGGGGKSLAMAGRGAKHITAHDIDSARMADLPTRAARAKARIRIAGASALNREWDLVIADVPCSGSGTWRRTPAAKWRLTQDDLGRLVETQAAILGRAADLVRPGGHVAYMTCSLLAEENGDQIARFLAARPEFEQISTQRFTPLNASDGFYLALLRKR